MSETPIYYSQNSFDKEKLKHQLSVLSARLEEQGKELKKLKDEKATWMTEHIELKNSYNKLCEFCKTKGKEVAVIRKEKSQCERENDKLKAENDRLKNKLKQICYQQVNYWQAEMMKNNQI